MPGMIVDGIETPREQPTRTASEYLDNHRCGAQNMVYITKPSNMGMM